MEYFFGIFIFIQGVHTLIAYLKIKKSTQSLPVLPESVLGISIGIFLVVKIDVTPFVFIVSLITWGIGAGVCRVIRSFFLYRRRWTQMFGQPITDDHFYRQVKSLKRLR
jgi:uncharacterized membrane protein HdeD (DUF308 family)